MWANAAQTRGYLPNLWNLRRKMREKLDVRTAVWDGARLRSAYLGALPARMPHPVVACGDLTQLILEQLQARAEAFALGERLQERRTNQGTMIPPASVLAVKEMKQECGNQCSECRANCHWAKTARIV